VSGCEKKLAGAGAGGRGAGSGNHRGYSIIESCSGLTVNLGADSLGKSNDFMLSGRLV